MSTELTNSRTVIEDSIECRFFSVLCGPDDNYWESVLERVQSIVKNISEKHIWHRDKFEVFLPINKNSLGFPSHLHSITCFGDNIEDEWFIVYMLLEITKQRQDLIVQVKDSDGELLLIEAANVLPAWANPDTTENRVYLHKSELHIIPPNLIDMKRPVTICDALNCIIKFSSETRASAEIQQSILKRIENYPQKVMDNIHRAVVHLPVKIASLLKLKPSLISPIVIAYCNHDAVDAKICRTIVLEDCIATTVTFTKCLYAMLMHSKLMPNRNNAKGIKNEEKKFSLGFKLACGFEILLNNSSKDTFATKEWNIYLNSLKNNGYFKENIEGSQKYSHLLERAKEYFIATECSYINSNLTDDIEHVMKAEDYKNLCQLLKNGKDETLTEDCDDWLQVHPDQLNQLLNSRFGLLNSKQETFKSDDIITPQTITKKLSNFLNQKSDFEGVETDDLQKTQGAKVQDDDKIDFDCKVFADTLKNILDFVVPEDNWDLDSGTDLSEYSSDDDIMSELKKSHHESAMDIELEEKLSSDILKGSQLDAPNMFHNVLQSVKEEYGASGPSSNLLNAIGIRKTDLELDSDDDEC